MIIENKLETQYNNVLTNKREFEHLKNWYPFAIVVVISDYYQSNLF